MSNIITPHHLNNICKTLQKHDFLSLWCSRVNRKEGHGTCLFNLLSSALLSSLELCLGWIVSCHNLSPCGPWTWSFGSRCGSHCEVWRIMTVACFRLSPNSPWTSFWSIYISIWVQEEFKRNLLKLSSLSWLFG